jgi:hypothetical protein
MSLSLFLMATLVTTMGEPDPATVDASLFTVASTGLHRFLEYRACSPEHCWSQSYLQWRDTVADKAHVTVPVGEIGYGTAVEWARWVWDNGTAQLELRLQPSHGGFEPHTVILKPGEPASTRSAPKGTLFPGSRATCIAFRHLMERTIRFR